MCSALPPRAAPDLGLDQLGQAVAQGAAAGQLHVAVAVALDDVAEVYGRIGQCLIAVSEGIEDLDGVAWGEKLAGTVEQDSHGNVQLSGSGALGDYLAELVRTKVSASWAERRCGSGPTRSAISSGALPGSPPRWIRRKPAARAKRL